MQPALVAVTGTSVFAEPVLGYTAATTALFGSDRRGAPLGSFLTVDLPRDEDHQMSRCPANEKTGDVVDHIRCLAATSERRRRKLNAFDDERERDRRAEQRKV